MTPITYISENDKDYAMALNHVGNYTELHALADAWLPLASDAFAVVDRMKTGDFSRFMQGRKLERKGQFAGEEFAKEFGPIIMPALMMQVSLVALKFAVPWGLAFKRLEQDGLITGRTVSEYGREFTMYTWKPL